MTATNPLDSAAVAACDPSGQTAEILDLPIHLRDALWRVDSAAIRGCDAPRGLAVAGMGGSAIGGRLARAVIGPRAVRPIVLAQGYSPPPWVRGEGWTVLCSSYSGSTEETLACYDAAGAAGVGRIAATTGGLLAQRARADGVPVIPLPGGFQPRAAVGYSIAIALEAAALCGAAPSLREEVEAAAALAERLAQEWGPDSADADAGTPKAVAQALHGRVPVVFGAELTAPVAYRWKCQVNENAKLPAFATEIPEHDHNEIEAWDAAGRGGSFAAVFLEDAETHPRIRRRYDVTADIVESAGVPVHRVTAAGDTRAERLVSLLLLGDLVSLYLAVLRGVDPGAIPAIDRLKSELAG